jgi:hypothetical protein
MMSSDDINREDYAAVNVHENLLDGNDKAEFVEDVSEDVKWEKLWSQRLEAMSIALRTASSISFLVYYANMPSCCGLKSELTEYIFVSTLLLLTSTWLGYCQLWSSNLMTTTVANISHNVFAIINLLWAGFSFGNVSVYGLTFGLIGCLMAINGNWKRLQDARGVQAARAPHSGCCVDCWDCGALTLVLVNMVLVLWKLIVSCLCYSFIGVSVTFPAYGKADHHFYGMLDPLDCPAYFNYTSSFKSFNGETVVQYCHPLQPDSGYSGCCVWER